MDSQIIVNGITASSIYVLSGLSFQIIYATDRFLHFAHGAVFAIGAYSAFFLVNSLGLSLVVSIPLAVIFVAIVGCSLDVIFFAHLRRRGSSPLVLLLASLGLYVVLQNMISLLFGDTVKVLHMGAVVEGMPILGARITYFQMCTVVVSVVVVLGMLMFHRVTRLGRAIRAVSNDPELATVCGIESGLVIMWAFAIGSALAGITGILVALDVDMMPTMGMHVLMMGVVAVIIGGRDSILGVACGALLLGMAQHLGAWQISSQWQDAIAFVILLVFLLFRPEGFMGKRVREATV